MTHIYEIKNLQTFRSPDGGGYNCTLWRDGQKVADCHEGGYGGEVEMRFNNGERQILDAHCVSLPKWPSEIDKGKEYDMTPDVFIGELVEQYQTKKHAKAFDRRRDKASKDNIVFSLTGDEDRSFRTMKIAPTQANLNVCVKHFEGKGGKKITICHNPNLKL